VSTSAQQVLVDVVNAMVGMRGYVVTGDPLFLQQYNLTLTRLPIDLPALDVAAVAQKDGRTERAAAASATTEMAELTQERSPISAGVPASALKSALVTSKQTADALRREIADLVQGPAAITAARRAGPRSA
jgi:CHASE3 domain sensor protein